MNQCRKHLALRLRRCRFRTVRGEEVEATIGKLRRGSLNGEAVNLSELLTSVSNDVVSGSALSRKYEDEDGKSKSDEKASKSDQKRGRKQIEDRHERRESNGLLKMCDQRSFKDSSSCSPPRSSTNRIKDSRHFRGRDFEYLPFGFGGRGCPGIAFAEAFIHYLVANLLYWFDWKLGDGENAENLDMDEAYGLTV
ncbi:hypothetical protein F3Y22_tig00002847pilonHSYRG00126 [Hibiscus syriacus]|uniref:Uncharacterized protein n=1 Tax=Hibiscus syriacus TaxID=106335 RepID=A0A6A3CTU7_HIBSY|nr:hypothetical protein F3Y22_tig00002847pilonHSYRG00126 [Hibiscus syriacus]